MKCGDIAAAHRPVREAETYAERLGLFVQDAHVRRTRAPLHLRALEHDVAAKLFELSADDFRRTEMLVEYAWTPATGARSAHAARGWDTAVAWLNTPENPRATRSLEHGIK